MSEGTQVADRECGYDGCAYEDGSPKEATLLLLEVESRQLHWRCGNHAAALIRQLHGPVQVTCVVGLRLTNAEQERGRLETDIVDTARRLRADGASPAGIIKELDAALGALKEFENQLQDDRLATIKALFAGSSSSMFE